MVEEIRYKMKGAELEGFCNVLFGTGSELHGHTYSQTERTMLDAFPIEFKDNVHE